MASVISTSFESMGDALVSGDFKGIAEAVIGSIADLLTQLGSTIIATGAAIEALKAAVASWNGIGAIAAGAALVVAGGMLKAVVSKLGAYETGGIVGGTSYYGDNVLARVNSGEMILNQGQQRNLFDAINSGNLGGGGSQTVEFKVSGSNLYGVLNNYNTRRSKL
jgi:hypothetical protein